MSEASVFNNVVPEGWYEDPAKPDMQRWWTGAEWTDHVRYAVAPRLVAVSQPPVIAAPQVDVPLATFDDAYVPMHQFQPGMYHMSPQRQTASVTGLWLIAIAVVGIAVGVALFVFLPR